MDPKHRLQPMTYCHQHLSSGNNHLFRDLLRHRTALLLFLCQPLFSIVDFSALTETRAVSFCRYKGRCGMIVIHTVYILTIFFRSSTLALVFRFHGTAPRAHRNGLVSDLLTTPRFRRKLLHYFLALRFTFCLILVIL